MRRYLLDTGIAGRYIDRRDGVYERARAEWSRGNWVGVTHPVLGELAARVEGSLNRERNMQRLRLALASWRSWPVTEEAAFEYGRIAAQLRRIGRMIGQNDIMIAAVALTLGNTTVVTMDSDFAAVPGWRSRTGRCESGSGGHSGTWRFLFSDRRKETSMSPNASQAHRASYSLASKALMP